MLFTFSINMSCKPRNTKPVTRAGPVDHATDSQSQDGLGQPEPCTGGQVYNPSNQACETPPPTPGGGQTSNGRVTCEEYQVIENDECKDTEEYCKNRGGMTLGANGCVPTEEYCNAIDLDFDPRSSMCLARAGGGSNQGQGGNENTKPFSLGGIISYYNGADQNAVTLALNGESQEFTAGSSQFRFSNALAANETYALSSVDPSQCSVKNGTGVIDSLDVSNVEVFCSDSLKAVKLNISFTEPVNRDFNFILNDTESVLYNGTNNDVEPFITFGSVATGSPISIAVENAVPIVCTFQQTEETDTEYVYSASCTDTDDLKVFAEVSGLEGSGLLLALNGSTFLPVSSNGSQAFNLALKQGDSFTVSVNTQPTNPPAACSVSQNATGVMGVNNEVATVSCVTQNINRTVTARVSGLQGTNLRLSLNDSLLTVNSNGNHVFPSSIVEGSTYAVTIISQPTHSTPVECTLSGETGTAGASDIMVDVACNLQNINYGFSVSGFNSSGASINNTVVNNREDIDDLALGSESNRFCLLSKVHMQDLDSGGEEGICEVYTENGITTLKAQLKRTGDADAACTSHCLVWQAGTFNRRDKGATRLNTKGIETELITNSNSASTFCGLSKVSFEEADQGDERVECRVISGPWSIRAEVLGGTDADARCRARCLLPPSGSGITRTAEESVDRIDAGGSSNITLANFANHYCFLTKVSFREIDSGGETAQCEVKKSGNFWILEATLGRNDDAWAKCSARCIKW